MSSSRSSPTSRPSSAPNPSRRPLLVVAAVVVVVLAALGIALVAGGGDDDTTDAAQPGTTADADTNADSGAGSTTPGDDAPVTVDGTALPPLPDGDTDPAVGMPMPVLSGTGLDGAPVTIPAAGRPTLVLFVAHWCPHCQAEVPVVQDWVDAGGLPAGVDLVTVSTSADPRRPNHPPGEWLASEGWTAPVLVDGDDRAATAAGLTAFPFFVGVDADGNVVGRTSGQLSADQLSAAVADLGGATS
jgi:thiol-disulfide isomerase/thioredoxin